MVRPIDRIVVFALVILLLLGVGLVSYPFVSNWRNANCQTRMISAYDDAVADSYEADLSFMREAAFDYNERLAYEGNTWLPDEERLSDYMSQMNVPGTDVMAYVEIPKLDCTSPIYHGADEAVLQMAIGHIEGSSLPVGGEGSHAAISGHRGLPSAKLFTDLDQLAEGDRFAIHSLGEELVYEVDRISVVLPHETEELEVVAGEDLCTLVTCTPYGVNSHRLLVRGHRVDAEALAPTDLMSDASVVDERAVAACLAAPMLLVIAMLAIARRGKKQA